MNNVFFHSWAMSVMRLFVTLVGLFWFGVLMGRADPHYVAQGGQTPSGSYTSWDTAASNIQDAINLQSKQPLQRKKLNLSRKPGPGMKSNPVAINLRKSIRGKA